MTTSNSANPVGWFEIPVNDMNRAIQFYETIFKVKLSPGKVRDHEMAFFPMVEGRGASGALVYHKPWYNPSKEGVLIYFTTPSGDLTTDLANIQKAGGFVLVPRESIGEHGFIAIFIDSEGNRIALHSMK